MEITPLNFNKYTKRTATNAIKCNSINQSINQPLTNRTAIYRGNNLSYYHGDDKSRFSQKYREHSNNGNYDNGV